MDYSNIYIMIGYTLVVIIATFWLRSKYPERYIIGCILCVFAPAWGHIYKETKYNVVFWMLFMSLERGVAKASGDDIEEILGGWLVVCTLSSIAMFIRLRKDKKSSGKEKVNIQETGNVKVATDSHEQPSLNEIDGLKSNIQQNLKNNISYETGISRIGIIIAIILGVSLSLYIINYSSSNDFTRNIILFPCLILSISITAGIITWGFIIFLFRVFIWIKYGFSDAVSYTVKNIYSLKNKFWPIVLVSLIIINGILTYFLKKANDNSAITHEPAATFYDPCGTIEFEADKVRIELEKLKQIYGRYPKNLNSINLMYMTQNSVHINKLTANSYKISFSSASCSKIFSIESGFNHVTMQIVK